VGVIAAATAALASGLAQAADLEVVKAEPTIYVPNNFLWGGVYVGGFVGGGWGTADWGPGLVPASVKVTTGTPPNTTSATTAVLLFIPHVNVPISGFLGGGQIGVNYQAGPFVFGFEGDFTGMTLKGHTTVVFSGSTKTSAATPTGTIPTTLSTTIGYTTTTVYQTTADWASTFTGRVGYTFDRVLAYGKVGAAVEQDGNSEVNNTTIPSTSCVATPAPATTSPPSTVACTAGAVSRAGTATRYGCRGDRIRRMPFCRTSRTSSPARERPPPRA
jgi:outer membrane immunogenic protein